MSEAIKIHGKSFLWAQIECGDTWLPKKFWRKDYGCQLHFSVTSMYIVDTSHIVYRWLISHSESINPRSIELKFFNAQPRNSFLPRANHKVVWSHEDNAQDQDVVKDFKATEHLEDGFERPEISPRQLIQARGWVTHPLTSSLLNGNDIKAIDVTWTSSGARVVGYNEMEDTWPWEMQQILSLFREFQRPHTVNLRLPVSKDDLTTVRRFVDVANPSTSLPPIDYGLHSYSDPSKEQLELLMMHEKNIKVKLRVRRREDQHPPSKFKSVSLLFAHVWMRTTDKLPAVGT